MCRRIIVVLAALCAGFLHGSAENQAGVLCRLAVGYSEEQDGTAAVFHLEKSFRSGEFPETATAKKLHGQQSRQEAGMR